MACFNEIVELFIVSSILQITAGLQCPSCSLVTTTGALGPLGALLESFQDANCGQKLIGSTKGIGEETCAAPSGKEARCSLYKGTLTMKITLIGTEIQLDVSKRACYYATTEAVPSNGCHDLNNLNEGSLALKDIIDQLTPVSDVHSLQGQRCLTSGTYGDTSSMVSSIGNTSSAVSSIGITSSTVSSIVNTSSAVSFLYKRVICNVLVMFVWKYL